MHALWAFEASLVQEMYWREFVQSWGTALGDAIPPGGTSGRFASGISILGGGCTAGGAAGVSEVVGLDKARIKRARNDPKNIIKR